MISGFASKKSHSLYNSGIYTKKRQAFSVKSGDSLSKIASQCTHGVNSERREGTTVQRTPINKLHANKILILLKFNHLSLVLFIALFY